MWRIIKINKIYKLIYKQNGEFKIAEFETMDEMNTFLKENNIQLVNPKEGEGFFTII